MNENRHKNNLKTHHRFLDEAGDTAFYGKGKKPIVGQPGVSNAFIIGMVKYKQPLEEVRKSLRDLQKGIENDPYYSKVHSVQRKIQLKGFYFHEPLLNVADYFCWAVQRVFERGEIRYFDFLRDKISLVVDLYDAERYANSRNYYTKDNPLTAQNKIGPQLH